MKVPGRRLGRFGRHGRDRRLLRALRGLALLALLAAGASACTTVRFNARARLAQPAMIFDRAPLAAEVRGDVLSAREAAIGGFSAGGAGGCGCN